MDKEKFLFRRQFILGPYFINNLPTWNRLSIDDKLFITVHPDLEKSKVTFGNSTIVLLGYILDPFNPSFNNLEIVNRIAEKISVADDIFQHLDSKCGRFVFIVKTNDELRILSCELLLYPPYRIWQYSR